MVLFDQLSKLAEIPVARAQIVPGGLSPAYETAKNYGLDVISIAYYCDGRIHCSPDAEPIDERRNR